MLERATACIDRGVHVAGHVRHRAPSSAKLLHSLFWSAAPPDHLAVAAQAAKSRRIRPAVGAEILDPNRPFLDFLYPARLPVLHATKPSSYGTGEKHTRHTVVRSFTSQTARRRWQPNGDDIDLDYTEPRQSYRNVHQEVHVRAATDETPDAPPVRIRRKVMLDKQPIALRKLQAIISGTRPADALEAYTLYKTLNLPRLSDQRRLRRNTILWMARRIDDPDRDVNLLKIYVSMPSEPGSTESDIFDAAFDAYQSIVRAKKETTLFEDYYRPILPLVALVPSTLFAHTISMLAWQQALKVLETFQISTGRNVLISGNIHFRSFFSQLSTLKDLTSYATLLADQLDSEQLSPKEGCHDKNLVKQAIFYAMCRQAVYALRNTQDHKSFLYLGEQVQQLFKHPYIRHNATEELYEPVLSILTTLESGPRPEVQGDVHIDTQMAHDLMAFVYTFYQKSPGFRPRKESLRRLLIAWKDGKMNSRSRADGFGVETILEDWRRQFGKLDGDAFRLIMEVYAGAGNVQLVTKYEQEYIDAHAGYLDVNMFWPNVYVHAVRKDAEAAQAAFARISTIHNLTPSLRCWNILLFAYQRAGNVAKAVEAYNQLLDQGIKPDIYTFGPLATLFANSGDAHGIIDVLDVAKENGLTLNTTLLNAGIVACVNENDLPAARERLDDAIAQVEAGTAKGMLTKCFNTIMTAQAVANDFPGVMGTYQSMKAAKVPLDGRSYGALMLALCRSRQPIRAYKILRQVVSQDHNIKPTAFHYAICMTGYLNIRQPQEALQVYHTMLDKGIQTNMSTEAAAARARALSLNHQTDGSVLDDNAQLSAIIDEMVEAVKSDKPEMLYTTEPVAEKHALYQGTNSAFANIDHLMYALGREKCFSAVKSLLSREDLKFDVDSVPLKILNAMMYVCTQSRDTQAVETLWQAIYRRTEQHRLAPRPVLKPASTPNERPPAPDPTTQQPTTAYRGALSEPLRYLMTSIIDSSQLEDQTTSDATVDRISHIFDTLLSQGYKLDNSTWNLYIQCLCQTSPPRARLAFWLTENYLIDDWPGWYPSHKKLIRHSANYARRSARREGTQYMRVRWLGPGKLLMLYETSVHLTAALLEVRKFDAVSEERSGLEAERFAEQVGSVQVLREEAPRALKAVLDMPVVYDDLQGRLLRDV